MSPRVLLVEDEAPQRAALQVALLAQWPGAAVLALGDGDAALEALAASASGDAPGFDVAFLDIRLPGASGLAVARAAIARGVRVVFTTAYDQHAVEAFEHGAVDYLLKPIRPERLAETLRRVELALAAGATASGPVAPAGLDALVAALQPARRLQWISASLGDTLKLIAVDEVLAFRAEDKMSRLLTADGDAVIRPSLKELLPQLDPERFWQVHRSAIVQVAAIAHVKRDELGRHVLRLKQRPDEPIPVSRAFLPRLRDGG